MKHFYRRHTAKGFAFMLAETLPPKVLFKHLGSDEQYEMTVTWLPNDSAESSWKVPEGAKKGTYQVLMRDKFERDRGVRVSGSSGSRNFACR